MEVSFYGIYMKHPTNKHGEWDEEKNRKIEAYKRGRYQRIRDSENSTGNSVSGKSSLCPHIYSLHIVMNVECDRLT